jgi:uncharacterized protein (TIGR00255 family)
MRSMTGYGKASRELHGKKFTVEIRSLNSRQLDLNLRIPSLYRELEAEVRGIASQLIQRGKADVSVSYDSNADGKQVMIDKELAKTYHKELKELARELGETSGELLPLVFRMPEVISTPNQEASKEEIELLKELVKEAVSNFDEFRLAEGKVLENDLLSRVEMIRGYLNDIEPFEQERIDQVRTRLTRSIEDHVGKEKIDNDRFEQEIIFYLEKLDITEEKTRLNTHCSYFNETAKEDASGRKLAFISQEMGREINTIGSKANHAEMQKKVVQMKDELEKIKEQLNNIL